MGIDDQLLRTIQNRLEAAEFDINSLEIGLRNRMVEDHRLRTSLENLRTLKHGLEEVLAGISGLDFNDISEVNLAPTDAPTAT